MSRENCTRYLYSGADPTWSDLYEEARPMTSSARRPAGPETFQRLWDAAKTYIAAFAVVLPMTASAAFAEPLPFADPAVALGADGASPTSAAKMGLDEILDGIAAGRPPRLPARFALLAAEAASAGLPTDLDEWSIALAADFAAAGPLG